MSRKYKFHDSRNPHFITFSTVEWIDIFTRRDYYDTIVNSLAFCIENKGLNLHSWCIMTNHIHLIASSETNKLSYILRDLKKFTSVQLLEIIIDNPKESRRNWLKWILKSNGQQNPHNHHYQLWQQHNHPIVLEKNEHMDKALDYIHQNPVKAGFVEQPEDWVYSSAKEYAGLRNLLPLVYIE